MVHSGCWRGGGGHALIACAAGLLIVSLVHAKLVTGGGAPPTFQAPPPVTQGATSYRIRIDANRPTLYLYRGAHLVHLWGVALGRPETATPVGLWKVIDKQRGWGSGFGSRWIGLDVPWGTYGIHGTNAPASIGRFASHGCIRMHNEDVEVLYDIVPIGTPVWIVGDPLAHIRRLEYGNAGADVRAVQVALQRLGYYRGPCVGRFDAATQFAVVYFQLAHHLAMDGVVDADDYRALGFGKSLSRVSK